VQQIDRIRILREHAMQNVKGGAAGWGDGHEGLCN
jgi:hypothetical protein